MIICKENNYHYHQTESSSTKINFIPELEGKRIKQVSAQYLHTIVLTQKCKSILNILIRNVDMEMFEMNSKVLCDTIIYCSY